MGKESDSLLKKLNIIGDKDIQTNVNLNLSKEIYFYLFITIVLAMLVGSVMSGIGKELIK